MKKETQDNSGGMWLLVSMVLGFWLLYYQSQDDERFLQTAKEYPVVKINDKDTTYVISLKIDSVYYDPQEHEPIERP